MTLTNPLLGDRIRLTSLVARDMPTLSRWYHDGLFLRLFDAIPARPRSERSLSEYVNDQDRAHDSFRFAVRPLQSEDLLGLAEIDGILWAHRVAWISMAIGDPEQRGKGYGRDAMAVTLRFAFTELNLYRIQLTVFAYNSPAISLYEKLGFRREGSYREFMERDGQRYDMHLYGLLRHEWQAGIATRSI